MLFGSTHMKLLIYIIVHLVIVARITMKSASQRCINEPYLRAAVKTNGAKRSGTCCHAEVKRGQGKSLAR